VWLYEESEAMRLAEARVFPIIGKKEAEHSYNSVYLVVFGLILHDVPEGVV
jgi:zinc transporter ZupT